MKQECRSINICAVFLLILKHTKRRSHNHKGSITIIQWFACCIAGSDIAYCHNLAEVGPEIRMCQ